jgi:hypothetical protein
MKLKISILILLLSITYGQLNAQKRLSNRGKKVSTTGLISPNDFKGSDTERIQAAIHAAKGTVNSITIPQRNANGTNIWMIDQAILLPSNMTVILDNCTLQQSDRSRDNMFRSDNVGVGISNPVWNKDIAIIGQGNVILKGADNPRATGDGLRKLNLEPMSFWKNKDRSSYGSDAGKTGEKQTSDWRNFMVLMAYVDGFKLKNVRIEYANCWAVTFERVHHAEISAIVFYTPDFRIINGKKVHTFNNDGIDLREGCKYFRINNITGTNGDDLIALSALDLGPKYHSEGNINSYQITSTKHDGPKDDIEQIFITNCKTNFMGVAIRASDSASIHHVYINGLVTVADPTLSAPQDGSKYTLLVGNDGYGKQAIPGKIHNIYASNIIGDGKTLIKVNSAIADCVFMNAIYIGGVADAAITYQTDKIKSKNITEVNLITSPKN